MIQKFLFKKVTGCVLMDGKVAKRRTEYISSLKDGEYEIVIRPVVKWDVARMRKYWHGPVLAFIQEQFKVVGCMYSKDQIKEYLKTAYGPKNDLIRTKDGGVITIFMEKSCSEYDFATYTKFLKDINAWSIECFGYELPASDEVE